MIEKNLLNPIQTEKVGYLFRIQRMAADEEAMAFSAPG
jgi:hypothetical protein